MIRLSTWAAMTCDPGVVMIHYCFWISVRRNSLVYGSGTLNIVSFTEHGNRACYLHIILYFIYHIMYSFLYRCLRSVPTRPDLRACCSCVSCWCISCWRWMFFCMRWHHNTSHMDHNTIRSVNDSVTRLWPYLITVFPHYIHKMCVDIIITYKF